MTNADQSTDTAATPTVHAPQVGQTRRQRGAATTFKILDEKCGNRIEYLCVYENGDEAWYPLPIVDAISSYVSGPEERDVDVILASRIDRAMVALPRPPWFDDYAARHILKAAEDTLAPEFTMPGEARPLLSTAKMIAILDLVECYQLRSPGGAHRPQPKAAVPSLDAVLSMCRRITYERSTWPSSADVSELRAFVAAHRDNGSFSLACSEIGALLEKLEGCDALDDLATKPYRVGTYDKSATDADVANLDAALKHLTSNGWIQVDQSTLRRSIGIPESTTDEPGRVISMTLDTTIPDRDTLALDYVKAHGVTGNRADSIAQAAYEYADAMIRNHATVPDDVKKIQFRTVNPGESYGADDITAGDKALSECKKALADAFAKVTACAPPTITAAPLPLTPSFEWAPLTGGERWCHAALNGITERAAIRPVHGEETWHARAFGQDLALEHPAVTTEDGAMAWVQAMLTAKLIELGMEREAAKIAPKPASGATA